MTGMRKTLTFSLFVWGLLWAVAAFGQQHRYSPCSPVFIAGPQGRPIPNNTVIVADSNNNQLTVYNDADGVAPFMNVLPANQILQVFYTPGVFRVTVSGDGLTKQYQIVCGEGLGFSAKMLSVDRTADVMIDGPAVIAPLTCPPNASCYRTFGVDVESSTHFDFILPSFNTTISTILLSWFAPSGTGQVVWRLDYCAYAVGENRCSPTGNNVVLVSSGALNPSQRTDASVTPQWTWTAGQHIVVQVTRLVSGTLLGNANLENVRLELFR